MSVTFKIDEPFPFVHHPHTVKPGNVFQAKADKTLYLRVKGGFISLSHGSSWTVFDDVPKHLFGCTFIDLGPLTPTHE